MVCLVSAIRNYFLEMKWDVRADYSMPIHALEKHFIEKFLIAPEEKDLWESFLWDSSS